MQNAGGLDDLFGGLAGSLVVPHVKYFREIMLYSQWDVRCAHFMKWCILEKHRLNQLVTGMNQFSG